MIEIIPTGDGSHSLRNTSLNETYHSVHGAMQESMHVFIRSGFDLVLDRKKDNVPIALLEIGFGTGLNAWLTLLRAKESGQRVIYNSLETYPLDKEIWSQLNYADEPGMKEHFARIHETGWNVAHALTPTFELKKISQSLQQAEFSAGSFDLIYFDAFAPNKQPEMWELYNLEKMARAMKPGGVFVTYCAKGQVKRDLRSAGLNVETLAGPPGKKEMVRAVK